jgi:hypothetical protein
MVADHAHRWPDSGRGRCRHRYTSEGTDFRRLLHRSVPRRGLHSARGATNLSGDAARECVPLTIPLRRFLAIAGRFINPAKPHPVQHTGPEAFSLPRAFSFAAVAFLHHRTNVPRRDLIRPDYGATLDMSTKADDRPHAGRRRVTLCAAPCAEVSPWLSLPRAYDASRLPPPSPATPQRQKLRPTPWPLPPPLQRQHPPVRRPHQVPHPRQRRRHSLCRAPGGDLQGRGDVLGRDRSLSPGSCYPSSTRSALRCCITWMPRMRY